MGSKELMESTFLVDIPDGIIVEDLSTIGILSAKMVSSGLPNHARGTLLLFFKADYVKDIEEEVFEDPDEFIMKATQVDDNNDDDNEEGMTLNPNDLFFQSAPWAFSIPGRTALSRSKKIIKMIKDKDFQDLYDEGINTAVLINKIDNTESTIIYIVSENMGYTTVILNDDDDIEEDFITLDKSTDLIPVMVRELRTVVSPKKNSSFEKIIGSLKIEENKKAHKHKLSSFVREDGAFDVEAALQSDDALHMLGLT